MAHGRNRCQAELDAAIHEVFGIKPVDDRVPALRVEATYRALDMLASN